MWPEEARRAIDDPGRSRRAADAIIARYQTAPWRRAAVASVRKLIGGCLKEAKHESEPPRPPDNEQLYVWLGTHDLADVVNAVQQDGSNNRISMRGALLAEAAGALFCDRPTVLRWRMVGQIIRNDYVAQKVFVDLVERRMSKRPALRNQIRSVAHAVVRETRQNQSGSTPRNDQDTLTEMRQRWKAKPDLHEIWFGLRALGHLMPFGREWHIFDLLLETDTDFAAELIEAYDEPYQPAMILQFGVLDPNRRFSDWERLMEAALPAFEADGIWNGRVLLPLLLLLAQDALRSAIGYRDESKDAAEHRDACLAELAEAVASTLRKRSDGVAAALRWGGWLFRSMITALDNERVPFPQGADSRARPAWLVIQSLMRSSASTAWLNLRPEDVAPEDELCLEAVRILAALEHDCPVPGQDLLFQILPDEPEDFLGDKEGKRRRELPSLFVLWGKRADAFGTRVLAAALFDQNVATTFADMWHRTLTLREIAEHGHAFRSDDKAYDDYARRASETIRFIIALGINLIDYVQDPRSTMTFGDRHATALALFSTLHDATREMLATDPIGRQDMMNAHNHLCLRRLIYEGAPEEKSAFSAPLTEADLPTAGDLLYERCEVSRPFFEGLQMLRINGITRSRIERALESVGVRLDHLIEQAQRLNAIEHNRTINLTDFETTGSVEAKSGATRP